MRGHACDLHVESTMPDIRTRARRSESETDRPRRGTPCVSFSSDASCEVGIPWRIGAGWSHPLASILYGYRSVNDTTARQSGTIFSHTLPGRFARRLRRLAHLSHALASPPPACSRGARHRRGIVVRGGVNRPCVRTTERLAQSSAAAASTSASESSPACASPLRYSSASRAAFTPMPPAVAACW